MMAKVSYLKIISRNSARQIEENAENLSQMSWKFCQDSNHLSAEYVFKNFTAAPIAVTNRSNLMFERLQQRVYFSQCEFLSPYKNVLNTV